MFDVRHVFTCLSVVAAFVAQLFVATSATAQLHSPALAVQPTQNSAAGYGPLRDACLNLGSWPTDIERADFFGNAYQFDVPPEN